MKRSPGASRPPLAPTPRGRTRSYVELLELAKEQLKHRPLLAWETLARIAAEPDEHNEAPTGEAS